MAQPSQSVSRISPTSDAIESALQHAITTTFEEMVFMELSGADSVELDGSQVHSRVQIHQPLCCMFTLQLSEGLVDACIDALYCGTEITDAVRQDIVNELANTIGGLMMSNLDESTPIALGLPSGAKGSPEPESGRPLVLTYQTDVGPLRVTVAL